MNMKNAFKMIDRDGNGYITVAEIKEAFDIYSNNGDKIYKEIMSEVDKNHDGLITFDEFSEAMNKVAGAKFEKLS